MPKNDNSMSEAAIEIPIIVEDGDKAEEDTDLETKLNPNDDKEVKDSPPKQRSVSFNRDVHVKRFGKPRETRGNSSDYQLRKEPFTHLSEKELIDEAAKVIAQAESVSCTTDHPPEKFFSLPHRKKPKDIDKKRKGEELTEIDTPEKKTLGRSTSDVGTPRKRGKERTSLSTLFRRAKTASPDRPVLKKAEVIVTTKPGIIVKRSKSDVSDLKSNPNLSNTNLKPIRKRSGSESEEFLKSLRNKKAQLSPIIESSSREDYFTSPEKQNKESKITNSTTTNNEESKKPQIVAELKKVNPVEKPPRFKSPDKQATEPKPPVRIKRSKAITDLSESKKPQEAQISETPKRKTEIKKTLLVDEIDKVRDKESPSEIKERIKESINKLQNNLYGDKEMIHSSQQPPDKLPLTKGKTVNHIVKILKDDRFSPPPKTLITHANSRSNNQPFSYTRPSVSPDPNLYVNPASPERPPSPINKMHPEKGVVYAQVVRNQNDSSSAGVTKQTIHKTYSSGKDYGRNSDEDEGFVYDDILKKSSTNKFAYNNDKKENGTFKNKDNFRMMDSPITPRFREFKLKSFDDIVPTYSNGFSHDPGRDYVDFSYRGRADGMDAKRRGSAEPETYKMDHHNLNDLSLRRQQLESRLNSRKLGEKTSDVPISKYIFDNDPIYEAQSRMKATEKYVNETARYYHHTLERDGLVENSVTDSYTKINSDNNNKTKYDTESRMFEKYKRENEHPNERYLSSEERQFPPEPEYEPPSLESNVSIDKKYKSKIRMTSSNDLLNNSQKYSKPRDESFGKRKGHYASNPEIVQEREEIYENAKFDPKYADTYHNSLRRDKSYDRQYKQKLYRENRLQGSDEMRDYKYDRSSRNRLDNDRDRENRFVDSGIENDFRKGSSGEISRPNRNNLIKNSPYRDSDDDGLNSSFLIASERRHTEDNFPSEQVYANGDFHDYPRKYAQRERSIDDGSHYDPKMERFENSPAGRTEDKVSSKPPPKPTKKLSGLEKVKQLFSSSKKSKKEKEVQKPRTRVLKSPEHLEDEYDRRYSPDRNIPKEDPIGRRHSADRFASKNDISYSPDRTVTKDERNYSPVQHVTKDQRKYSLDRFLSKEDIRKERRYSPDRIIPKGEYHKEKRYSPERKYSPVIKYSPDRYTSKDQRSNSPDRLISKETYSSERFLSKEQHRSRKYSPVRGSKDSLRKERYSPDGFVPKEDFHRRYKEYRGSSEDRDTEKRNSDSEGDVKRQSRLRSNNYADSPRMTERYSNRRRLATPSPSPPRRPLAATTAGNWFKSLDRLTRKRNKTTKVLNEDTETESTIRKPWSKKPDSPAKNLRFFGDTDVEESNTKQKVTKTLSHPQKSQIRTKQNQVMDTRVSRKSNSLSNLRDDSPKRDIKYRRNLHNISENHSNSETESLIDSRRVYEKESKPPIPYDRRSRSKSGSVAKGSKSDLRKNGYSSSRSELREGSSDARSSKERGSRGDLRSRRRTPANSGESSTEGESSHQSQRSVVYLHATTIGDIPDPARTRARSRDDVSSVSSQQVKTVTRSFSFLAPWRPRHYAEPYDVHYTTTRPNKRTHKQSNKNASNLQKNRSASQTTLNRKKLVPSRLSSSNNTLYKKRSGNDSSKENINTLKRDRDYKSTELLARESDLSDRERISRSISMPKDESKKAGWFKLTKKKNEQTSRVR